MSAAEGFYRAVEFFFPLCVNSNKMFDLMGEQAQSFQCYPCKKEKMCSRDKNCTDRTHDCSHTLYYKRSKCKMPIRWGLCCNLCSGPVVRQKALLCLYAGNGTSKQQLRLFKRLQ